MKRSAIIAFSCFSIWAFYWLIVLIGDEHSGLVITSPRWSTLVCVAICFLPTAIQFWCVTALRGWLRIALVGLVTPIALLSYLIAFFYFRWNYDNVVTDTDTEVHLLKSLNVDGTRIRAYRLTRILCEPAIAIRQERPLLPGLIWRTSLYKEDQSQKDRLNNPGDVTFSLMDRHHIRCTFFPYPGSDEPMRTIVLTTNR